LIHETNSSNYAPNCSTDNPTALARCFTAISALFYTVVIDENRKWRISDLDALQNDAR